MDLKEVLHRPSARRAALEAARIAQNVLSPPGRYNNCEITIKQEDGSDKATNMIARPYRFTQLSFPGKIVDRAQLR
jgi:hypothetical protein